MDQKEISGTESIGQKGAYEITINPDAPPQQLILGSRSDTEMLPVQDIGDPSSPPPPSISAPDIGIHVLDITGAVAENINVLVDALKGAFGLGSETRRLSDSATKNIRIGLWLSRSVSPADDMARERGLAALSLINRGKIFGVFVNSSYIRRKADEAWSAQPKRLNSNGQPDPQGPIHLTGYSMLLDSATHDIATTTVFGYDERPFPDIDFQLEIKEKLGIVGGKVLKQAGSQVDLKVNTSWLHYLVGLFAMAIPTFNILWTIQSIGVLTAGPPSELPLAVGGRLVQQLPTEFLIPGGNKILLEYDTLSLHSGGFFVAGFPVLKRRTPSMHIRGRGYLLIREGESAIEQYGYAHQDLLNPKPTWTADGTVRNPDQETTLIDFDTSGARDGDVLTRKVTATLTDQDGLTATDMSTVEIAITHRSGIGPPPV